MTITVEGAHSIYLATPSSIVEEAKEVAWEGATDLMRLRPEIGYLLGRYIETDKPNQNGHVFALDDVRTHIGSVVHTSANMGHRERYIIGSYVAAELMYPAGEAAGEGLNAYVETLSTFYRNIFRDEWLAVRGAHAEGSLFQSMECVPATLTCVGEGGCGRTFPYKGVRHESYCDHLNEPRSIKRLDAPNFQGGGLIIPPMRPGWRRADITQVASEQRLDAPEMAKLIAENVDQAECVYDQIVRESPNATAAVWDAILLDLMDAAYPAGTWKKKRKPMARQPEVRAAAPMNGGMVCLYPDPADAEAIAAGTAGKDGADPADRLHVTLAYVARDVSQMPLDAKAAVLEAARAGAEVRSEPLELTVGGIGTLGKDEPQATVLFLQSKDNQSGLAAVAGAVRAELDDFGSEAFPPEHDGFIGHLTIGYGVEIAAAEQFVGRTFRFSRGVSAHLGDACVDYPWGTD